MTAHGFDPEIVQDFLTESAELLEQLESDLIVLELRPTDLALLNRVFRALHTIKGSASFLALTELVEIAHAAESALNAARSGALALDHTVTDLLLRATDVLRTQFDRLESGKPLPTADASLVAALAAAADGTGAEAAHTNAGRVTHEPGPLGARERPIERSDDNAEPLDALASDLEQTLASIDEQFAALTRHADADRALRVDGVLADTTPEQTPPAPSNTTPPAAEQTIRVEIKRLDTLMDLAGELTLRNNRLGATAREITPSLTRDRREHLSDAAADLDRVTRDIQAAVMRTRMQPLARLFSRYPRIIRDLAARTGKRIRLEIEGAQTEVDRSVIEHLGDSLVHLMRNSADHGIEAPGERADAGKPAEGVIRLTAAHEGSRVRIRIADDGRGLDRDRIGAAAVRRGLTTEPELATLSDARFFDFIFAPGFSTAHEVSDISGRGVGMDVVRTSIERLTGSIDVASTPGRGTELCITIPLTIALMPAMLVAVGDEEYALPLGGIAEIVRPRPEDLSTIGGVPAMRLRDGVLPLLSGPEVFDHPDRERIDTPFVVVLTMNDTRIGLLVTRPVGRQDVVVKPLDVAGRDRVAGPISGANVRDDGGVSLVIDIAGLFRIAEGRRAPAAA